MLMSIMQCLSGGNAKKVPYWDRLVQVTQIRMNESRNRYLRTASALSKPIRLLREILTDVSFDDLSAFKRDRDRYAYLLAHEERLKSHYDSIIRQNSVTDIFVNNKCRKIIPEYYLRTLMQNEMTRLPFDRPWHDWKHLRAVEVVYYNSIELVEQLFSHTLEFKKEPPDYVVVSINAPLMVMQMYQYSKTLPPGLSRYDQYLHDIVGAQWFDDIIRIWLMNLLDRGIDDELAHVENFDMGGWVWQKVPKEISKAISDEIQKVKTGNITLSDFLKTPWIGRYSLWDYAVHMHNDLCVPNLRQYEFLKFMKELPLMKMIIKINRFRRGCADYERITSILKRELTRYRNNNYAGGIHSLELRSKFTKEVDFLHRIASFL